MELHIDDNVMDIIGRQDPDVKKIFIEVIDRLPKLFTAMQEALDRNEFDTALTGKDAILEYCGALRSLAMQFHRMFGIHDEVTKVWGDDEVKAIINEATRIYGMATDLIVNKFQSLELQAGEHSHIK